MWAGLEPKKIKPEISGKRPVQRKAEPIDGEKSF